MSDLRLSVFLDPSEPGGYPFSPRTWPMEDWDRWTDLLVKNHFGRLVINSLLDYRSPKADESELRWFRQLRKIAKLCSQKGIHFQPGTSVSGYLKEEYHSVPFLHRNPAHLDYLDPSDESFEASILNSRAGWLNSLKGATGWWFSDGAPNNSVRAQPEQLGYIYLHLSKLCPDHRLAWMMREGWHRKNYDFEEGWQSELQPCWARVSALFRKLHDLGEIWVSWPGHEKSLPRYSGNRKMFYLHDFVEPAKPDFLFSERTTDTCEDFWDDRRALPVTLSCSKRTTDTCEDFWDSYPEADGLILALRTPCLRNPALLRVASTGLLRPSTDCPLDDLKETWCHSPESWEVFAEHWSRINNELNQNEKPSTTTLKSWMDYVRTP